MFALLVTGLVGKKGMGQIRLVFHSLGCEIERAKYIYPSVV